MNTTKRRIFETAIKLFAQKGYDGASIEEITSIVGIAKGTLYYHFNSKEEIFNHLVSDGIYFMEKSIDIKTRNINSVIQKIEKVIEIQIKVAKEYDKFMIFLFSQCWGGEDKNVFVREKINKYIDRIEKIIIEGKDELKVKETRVVAELIFGQISSILIYKLSNNKEIDIEELSKHYLNILLKGIK